MSYFCNMKLPSENMVVTR